MTFSSTRKVIEISLAEDAKEGVLKAVGDISDIEVFHNQILLGTYVRPEKTRGGIILTNSTLKEDEYQGKVFLVLKIGPTAFKSDDEVDFAGQSIKEGDWVVVRPGDAWQMNINGTPCRIASDRAIRMRVANPEVVF